MTQKRPRSLSSLICNTQLEALKRSSYTKKDFNQVFSTGDWAGYTPLTFAIAHGWKEGVDYLFNNGADLNLEDAHGHIPLVAAMDACNINLFIKILGWNPNLLQSNSQGDTPFHWLLSHAIDFNKDEHDAFRYGIYLLHFKKGIIDSKWSAEAFHQKNKAGVSVGEVLLHPALKALTFAESTREEDYQNALRPYFSSLEKQQLDDTTLSPVTFSRSRRM